MRAAKSKARRKEQRSEERGEKRGEARSEKAEVEASTSTVNALQNESPARRWGRYSTVCDALTDLDTVARGRRIVTHYVALPAFEVDGVVQRTCRHGHLSNHVVARAGPVATVHRPIVEGHVYRR